MPGYHPLTSTQLSNGVALVCQTDTRKCGKKILKQTQNTRALCLGGKG